MGSEMCIRDRCLARVFMILAIKHAELQEQDWKYRARVVLQGNNVRTKTGRAPYEVFEEISNAPASITAARAALAVARLKGMTAKYRDAFQAYLQTRIDLGRDPVTLIELPREWWPLEWFENGDLTRPRYRRPAVVMRFAIPGHPKSGFLWEEKVIGILTGL